MNMLARFALLMPVVAIGLGSTQVSAEASQEWVNPVIKEYGKVRPYPHAAAQPDAGKQYKILFSLTKPPESVDKVNPGLEHVARLINLFAFAKVPVGNLHIVAVVHGSATASVLDDAHYLEKHKTANPNIKLISALRRVGVKVFVCGQALAHADLQPEWVNPDVTLALAALTVLPIYESQGYSLIPE